MGAIGRSRVLGGDRERGSGGARGLGRGGRSTALFLLVPLELGYPCRSVIDMTDRSSPPSASLELLLEEIEATPREYWADLLNTLREFRQKIPPATPSVIDVEQARKNQAAIELLDSWLSDDEDASEQQQAWDFLKTALDEDRLSDRQSIV